MSDLERWRQAVAVTVPRVRDALARAEFRLRRGERVAEHRPGCVWVEVVGLTAGARRQRITAVKEALSEQKDTL